MKKRTKRTTYAKLDDLDYTFYNMGDCEAVIKFAVDGNTDPLIADIATEINACEGYIYVEGNYMRMTSMDMYESNVLIIRADIL